MHIPWRCPCGTGARRLLDNQSELNRLQLADRVEQRPEHVGGNHLADLMRQFSNFQWKGPEDGDP